MNEYQLEVSKSLEQKFQFISQNWPDFQNSSFYVD